MATNLFECGCLGASNYCPDHGKPVDQARRLKKCRACGGRGKTYESMYEDPCLVCQRVGYVVVEKKR